MPSCNTRFHGFMDFEREQVLEIPSGLFGFPAEREFLLLEVPSRRPMVFVQSTRTPDLCFIALPVQVIDKEYRLNLTARDAQAMSWRVPTSDLKMGNDLLCLAFLTIGDSRPVTANLLTPLVIDIAHHKGLQVMAGPPYSHEHPVLSPALSGVC